MKRIITLAVAAIFGATTLQASEKTANLNYNRNGLSIIVMEHGDDIDAVVRSAFKSEESYSSYVGTKFDVNPLKEKFYNTNQHRTATSENKDKRLAAMRQSLENTSTAKAVLSHCFMYDEKKGNISIDRILERGEYNATDRNYDVAAATRRGVSELGEQGFEMLKQNYIIALDVLSVQTDESGDHSVKSDVAVYKVVYNEEIHSAIDAVFAAEGAEQRASLFNAIPFSVEYVASTTVSTSATKDEKKEAAIRASVYAAVRKMEKKISSWAVKAPVEEVNPIRAKIGTKEGLRNGQRYYSYETVYSEKKQKERIKRTAVVRATEIADNKTTTVDNKGESPSSAFYQIAGVSDIKPGQVLVQKNDKASALSLGYNSMDLFYMDYDMLLYISTSGYANYGMLTLGTQSYKDVDMWYGGKSDMSAYRYGMGYGWGVRPIRALEIVPYVKMFADILTTPETSGLVDVSMKTGDETKNTFGYAANAGVKLNLNLVYPLQFYIHMDYTHMFFTDSAIYKGNNLSLAEAYPNEFRYNREGVAREGLAFGFGARYSF